MVESGLAGDFTRVRCTLHTIGRGPPDSGTAFKLTAALGAVLGHLGRTALDGDKLLPLDRLSRRFDDGPPLLLLFCFHLPHPSVRPEGLCHRLSQAVPGRGSGRSGPGWRSNSDEGEGDHRQPHYRLTRYRFQPPKTQKQPQVAAQQLTATATLGLSLMLLLCQIGCRVGQCGDFALVSA